LTHPQDLPAEPRKLASIRCARCGCEVERVTVSAPTPGALLFTVECHGERAELPLDEHQLDGHKIVGGEAFGSNPGIDLRPWGAGYAP
jgi:hypothetical protein